MALSEFTLPNNFMGDATVANLDDGSLVRYNNRPEINPIAGAAETSAIYVRLPGGFGPPVFQYGLYVEIPSVQNYTYGGAATKVIHDGHGDAHYVAMLNGITAKVITAMTGAGVQIVCTIVGHGFGQGDVVQISGCLGNTAANGVWYGITVIDADTFSLPASLGNGAYVANSGSAQDINSPIGYEAAAYGDGTVGFLSSMQHAGGRANWQGFQALYQQNALLNYAAFSAHEVPNNSFVAGKRTGLADLLVDGLTQFRILEAAVRMIDGEGVAGGNYKGGWDPAAAYVVNDTVVLGSSAYACTAPNVNQQPPNAAFWLDVTDATNANRIRFGAYNDGDVVQQSLRATAADVLCESPEHRLRASYWDGAAARDYDAVLKCVLTAATPTGETRLYMGDPVAPQLAVVFRKHAGGGGDVDLQNGSLLTCGQITAAATGMPIDQLGGAISNCGGLTMKAGGGQIDLQGNAVINCVNIQSNTAQLDLYANAVLNLELAPPADGETALLVRRNVGGAYSLQRVSMGAADSGGVGYKVLRVPN